MISDAHFSPCRRWRYRLSRRWGPGTRMLTVIGLNPSTADEMQDDPTIRRCMGYARREGCDGLIMLNLFGFRATDPQVMRAQDDPVGPHNEHWITTVCREAFRKREPILAAWGTHGTYLNREAWAYYTLPPLLCLGVTQAGSPKHPLYLKKSEPLVPWQPDNLVSRYG